MNDLLKEAIADAKAVRETALANAKLALEEAFTPRIQSMLSAKLAEDADEFDSATPDEGPAIEEDEQPYGGDFEDVPADERGKQEPASAEAEGDADYEKKESYIYEDDAEAELHATEDELGAEDKYADELEASEGYLGEEGEEVEVEDELDLESIIKELEGGLYEDDEAAGGSWGEEPLQSDEEGIEEVSDSSDIGKGENKQPAPKANSNKAQDDPGKGKLTVKEDFDLDINEIIAALREDDDYAEDTDEGGEEAQEVEDAEVSAAKVEEAYQVIRFLRSKINEVNLLNAKLLFSNKLFRNFDLNESQKLKVIENFDRAGNLREVKLVFATLCESFNIRKGKKQIRESFASKPGRSTRPNRKILKEGNVMANRFKKLAGLIK